MITDIISGNLSAEAIDIIGAATSVAIDKGGDAVRPLAVPEIMYKIASTYLLQSVTHAIPDLFPKIQLGCGMPNGVETALIRTQLALELGGPGSDTIVLSLDCRNAFNERKRELIAKALFAAPTTSRLWRFFMTFYGNGHSHLGVYSRGELIFNFLNSCGVKQGDPLASLFYALSVQELYVQTLGDDPMLEGVAIADDFTITGPATRVILALHRFIGLTRDDGPALNTKKSKVLWAYSTSHPSYRAFLAEMTELGIPISYDCIPLLGSSIGLRATRAARCLAAADSHEQFFNALQHEDMPAHIAVLILRSCGQPLFSYLDRVVPPVILREAAKKFDEHILRTMVAICDLPPPDAAGTNSTHRSITLPLRFDGMGFIPHTSRSPSAYWTSWATSAHDVRTSLFS